MENTKHLANGGKNEKMSQKYCDVDRASTEWQRKTRYTHQNNSKWKQ